MAPHIVERPGTALRRHRDAAVEIGTQAVLEIHRKPGGAGNVAHGKLRYGLASECVCYQQDVITAREVLGGRAVGAAAAPVVGIRRCATRHQCLRAAVGEGAGGGGGGDEGCRRRQCGDGSGNDKNTTVGIRHGTEIDSRKEVGGDVGMEAGVVAPGVGVRPRAARNEHLHAACIALTGSILYRQGGRWAGFQRYVRGGGTLAVVAVGYGHGIAAGEEAGCGRAVQAGIVAPSVIERWSTAHRRYGDAPVAFLTEGIFYLRNVQTHRAGGRHGKAANGRAVVAVRHGDGVRACRQTGGHRAVQAGVVAPGVVKRRDAALHGYGGGAVGQIAQRIGRTHQVERYAGHIGNRGGSRGRTASGVGDDDGVHTGRRVVVGRQVERRVAVPLVGIAGRAAIGRSRKVARVVGTGGVLQQVGGDGKLRRFSELYVVDGKLAAAIVAQDDRVSTLPQAGDRVAGQEGAVVGRVGVRRAAAHCRYGNGAVHLAETSRVRRRGIGCDNALQTNGEGVADGAIARIAHSDCVVAGREVFKGIICLERPGAEGIFIHFPAADRIDGHGHVEHVGTQGVYYQEVGREGQRGFHDFRLNALATNGIGDAHLIHTGGHACAFHYLIFGHAAHRYVVPKPGNRVGSHTVVRNGSYDAGITTRTTADGICVHAGGEQVVGRHIAHQEVGTTFGVGELE